MWENVRSKEQKKKKKQPFEQTEAMWQSEVGANKIHFPSYVHLSNFQVKRTC